MDNRRRTGLTTGVYEESGVPHYWLADPAGPSITVLDLAHGQYEQTAVAHGGDVLTLSRPFDIDVVPTELVLG